MFFEVINQDHPLRTAVEEQIRGVYLREYDAKLSSLPNTLVALLASDGKILCAAGLRFAKDSFFSERYLSGPVEKIISGIWKRPVAREQVAEVACLAGCKAGMSLALVRHIVNMLRKQGITWAFFTATKSLRLILRRSGVPALDVAPADISRIDDPQNWGAYYSSDPRVVAIHDDMVTLRGATKQTKGAAALA